MSEYREYNGDSEHDMWVDYTYHEYTDESYDWCDEDNADDVDCDEASCYVGSQRVENGSNRVENCSQRSGNSSHRDGNGTQHERSSSQRGGVCRGVKDERPTSELIKFYRQRIAKDEKRIKKIEADIERLTRELENPNLLPRKILALRRELEKLPGLIANYQANVEKDEAKLVSLLIKREKELNHWIIRACVFAILCSLVVFWMIY